MAANASGPALADRVTGYDTIALALQGGGALGAYQAGVYEALDEAGIVPNRLSGISIGAFNAAIIAGNPPERRVGRLHEFWDTICSGLPGAPWLETST
jgi:NTE family protein